MSYVTRTLGAKERILYRTGYHWLYWLAANVLAAPAFAIALAGYPYGPREYFLGVFALVALPFGLTMLVRAYATEIVLTSDRFVKKHGLISYEVEEVSLDKIEEVTLAESVLGRILDYGTLHVHGTGEANILVRMVAHPVELRRRIQSAREDLTRTG